MKKRLRKKLRLKEFQEMGFSVKVDLNIPNTDEANFAFEHRLIQLIEGNHLIMGGGSNDFVVCANTRRTATEADRATVETWLRHQPEVVAINVGPLVDAWYGVGRNLSAPGDGLPNLLAAHILSQAGITIT
jgi:uncharacterized protein YggL (DUF469 family)